MSAFIITRIQVGDYDTWRPLYDRDVPRARENATAQRVFRRVDDPNHVFVFSSSRRSRTRRRAGGVSSRRESSIGSMTGTGRTSSRK